MENRKATHSHESSIHDAHQDAQLADLQKEVRHLSRMVYIGLGICLSLSWTITIIATVAAALK